MFLQFKAYFFIDCYTWASANDLWRLSILLSLKMNTYIRESRVTGLPSGAETFDLVITVGGGGLKNVHA